MDIIHKKGAHYSLDERRYFAIHYAKQMYAETGCIRILQLNKIIIGASPVLFKSASDLISAAGLPDDALFGSGNCLFCDKKFKKNSFINFYCSNKCKVIRLGRSRRKSATSDNLKKNSYAKCLNCGNKFLFMSTGGYKYCSDICMKANCRVVASGRRRARKNNVPSFGVSRSDIIKRDGTSCRHCKIKCVIDGDIYQDCYLNLDHIIPLSKGGHDAEYNIQILCRKCNTIKRDRIDKRDYDLAEKMWPIDIEKTISSYRYSRKHKPRKNSSSGFRGVFFKSDANKWRAWIDFNKKRLVLVDTEDLNHAISCRKKAQEMVANGATYIEIKEARKEFSNGNA